VNEWNKAIIRKEEKNGSVIVTGFVAGDHKGAI
jgi:hypothetical protein